MTTELEQARTALDGLPLATDITGLALVAQPRNKPPVTAQVQTTAHAVTDLAEMVRATAEAYSDSALIPYAPTRSTSDGEVMWISTSAVPLLSVIASTTSDLANLELFDSRAMKMRDVRLAVVCCQSAHGPVLFVQPFRSDRAAAKTKKRMLLRNGVLDVPHDEELAILRTDVSVAVVGDFAFFTDRQAFQRVFGLLDEMKARAEDTLREVTVDLRIDNFDQMLRAVTTSSQMLGKMASIQDHLTRYPRYRDALTMTNLVEFVESHPQCKVEITGQGNDARFVFRNDPQHRYKILNLLDDDYLKSELTELEYEANSKSEPLG